MKTIGIITGLAFCSLGLTQQAHAQSADGLYIAAAATGSDLDRPKQTIANAPMPGSTLLVENAIDFGWGGEAAVGYAYRFIRVEAEVGYTENDSKSYSAITPLSITLPQDGKNNITRYMANLYAEVPQSRHWTVNPFIGAGIGAAHAHVTTFAAPARAPTAPPSQLIDQRDTIFAYQLMAGLSVPLARRIALTAQYRWLDAGTVRGVDSRGERITRQIHGGNFDLGLRFRF